MNSYQNSRKHGGKRKAMDGLRHDSKKQKLDPQHVNNHQDHETTFLEDPAANNSDPEILQDQIDSLQRELALLNSQIKQTSAGTAEADLDDEFHDIVADFSDEEVEDSEIQVDDGEPASRPGISQSRSRRTPRPNRHFSEYEVDPEEQTKNEARHRTAMHLPGVTPTIPPPHVPNSNSIVLPPVVPTPVQPQTPLASSLTKRTMISAPIRRSAVTPLKGSRGGGRGRGTAGRGRGGRGRGRWAPVLPAPPWPKPRLTSSVPKRSGADPMAMCAKILRDLMKHKHGWVFEKPVDPVALDIKDYYTVITHPMDLGTVKTKLSKGQYSSVADFAEDVRLTFRNAMTYNPPTNDVHLMAKTLSNTFEDKLPKAQELESVDPLMKKTHLEQTLAKLKTQEERHKKQLAVLSQELEKHKQSEIIDISPPLKPKADFESAKQLDYDEKLKLSQNMSSLGLRYMKGVLQILEEEKPAALKPDAEIVDVDIDRLEPRALRRLEAYVAECRVIEKERLGTQAEPEQPAAEVKAPPRALKEEPHKTTTAGAPSASVSTTQAAAPVVTPVTSAATAEAAPGTKKKEEESEESSSSSSDSSSSDTSDTSSDSDDEDDGKKVAPTLTSTKSKHHKSSSDAGTAASQPEGSKPANGIHTTPAGITPGIIPGSNTIVPTTAPKLFVLPTQKVEEKVVTPLNVESWSDFAQNSNTETRKVTSEGSTDVPAQTSAAPGPPATGNSAGVSANPAEARADDIWVDAKKRSVLNKQRERDRLESEAAIQRKLEEDKQKLELEAEARRKEEEERKRKEQEEELQKKLAKDREMELLREAERAKREKVAPSVNLTSQSEIMANIEKGLTTVTGSVDMSSLLGLTRRFDDD